MTAGAQVSPDAGSVTVSVPLAIRGRGGRKLVITPGGAPDWAPLRPKIETTLTKALARAFRWRRLLEDGVYATVNALARAERINGSYVSRVLRLTLLAPEIVEGIVNGRHPPELTTAQLLVRFPVQWEEQKPKLRPQ